MIGLSVHNPTVCIGRSVVTSTRSLGWCMGELDYEADLDQYQSQITSEIHPMLQTQGQSKEYATGSASTSSRGASEVVYTEAGSLGRAWSH